jgi:DNA-binding beta-propeller fold protein YncE
MPPSEYSNSTILAVSAEQSQPLVFSIKGEFARTNAFETFHVSPSGKVYVLTTNVDHRIEVFQFDHDGDMKNPVKIDAPSSLIVENFGVFESTGNFLIWGYYGARAAKQERGKPFVALVDSSGRILLRLPEGKKTNLKTTSDTPAESSICLGADGNMYVLTSDHVLVLDGTGKVRRRISVLKPNSADLATKLVVSDNWAIIWLETNAPAGKEIGMTFEVIDLSTRRVIGIYKPSEELGTNAVSFSTQDGFVFLENNSGRISILTAATR